jgi:CDP-diacylglycerol pyrophosphatase
MKLIRSRHAIQPQFLFGVLVAVVFSAGPAQAANCNVEQNIPANQQQIGSGSATAGSDGDTTVTGDQAVYVQVKNVNVLGASYTVTIARDTTPVDVICSYTAILLPQTSVILSGAVFASPPIGWKITVSVGDESDAAVLTYTVSSLKPTQGAGLGMMTPSARSALSESASGAMPLRQSSSIPKPAPEAIWRHSEACTKPERETDKQDLWQLAKAKCLQSSTLCAYNPRHEYIVAQDSQLNVKPSGYLLIPSGERVSGIESDAVFQRPLLDLWDDAWQDAQHLDLRTSRIGMAVNSRCQRTEGQLHIHISCLHPAVISALQASNASQFGLSQPFDMHYRNETYHVVKVGGLSGENSPFRVVQRLLNDRDQMGGQGVAVIPAEMPNEFYILITTYLGEGGGGFAEELLDQTCSASQ